MSEFRVKDKKIKRRKEYKKRERKENDFDRR